MRNKTPKKPRRIRDLKFDDTMNGIPFTRQFQRAIVLLYLFMVNEWEHYARSGSFMIPLHKVFERTAAALQIHVKTAKRYIKQGLQGLPLYTPGKDKKVHKNARNVDDFTKGAIRRLIYEFHRDRSHFTLKTLLDKIREREISFHGCKETLRLVLHDIGFKFKKRNGRRYLMELPRITLLRIRFLKRFMDFKMANLNFIYTDETWFFQFGSGKTKEWQDDDVKSCSTRHVSSTGKRYILVHAGGSQGFVEGACLCYCSATKPKDEDDYHGQVNCKIMRKYWSEDLIPNLPDTPCVIVQDNVSYHMSQVMHLKAALWKARLDFC